MIVTTINTRRNTLNICQLIIDYLLNPQRKNVTVAKHYNREEIAYAARDYAPFI